jgi:hypothetical protein
MTMIYRLTQGVRAVVAFTQTVDYTLPEQYLSPSLLAAFKQMQTSEQLHSIRVLRTVLAQEADTPSDLAIAALMHDCGKARYPLSLYGKTISVLAQNLAPAFYDYANTHDAAQTRWARPFIVRRQHAAWGAAILQQAGASQRAVWLVAHHQEVVAQWMDHPYAALLWRLQQADDTN